MDSVGSSLVVNKHCATAEQCRSDLVGCLKQEKQSVSHSFLHSFALLCFHFALARNSIADRTPCLLHLSVLTVFLPFSCYAHFGVISFMFQTCVACCRASYCNKPVPTNYSNAVIDLGPTAPTRAVTSGGSRSGHDPDSAGRPLAVLSIVLGMVLLDAG